jgi:DNA-binding MarR family transcriptional regulator
MDQPTDLISISAYAEEKKITKQAVSKSVDKLASAGLLRTWRNGRSVVFSRSEYERAKTGAADPARELATEMARDPGSLFAPPSAEPETAPAAPDDPYRRAAAEEKATKARRAAIELAQLEGSIVDRDEVIRAEMTVARAFRNAVLGACGTAADRVAALPDPKDARAVKSILTATMKQALTQLADAMPKWKGAEAAPPSPGDD